MSVTDYVSQNFIALFEMAGLIILLFTSVHSSRQTALFTRLSVLLLFFNSVVYYLETWTQTFETLSILRPMLTATIYSIQPFILISVMLISEPPKKKEYCLLIPAVAAIPFYYTTQWTHYVIWFSQDNHYHGGLVSYLPYIIFGFYVAVFIARAALTVIEKGFRDGAVVIALALIAVGGVILYIIFDISSDYTVIFATSILLYYLYYYIHLSKSDPLTRAYNRQCFYRDEMLRKRDITAAASVDVNELKWVNDTQGHAAGDQMLRTVANCLGKVEKRKSIYRVGGDEFVILYRSQSPEKVAEDIKNMQDRLSKTPYSCAFGYALMKDASSVSECVQKADAEMYKNKEELKRKNAESGGTLHLRQ